MPTTYNPWFNKSITTGSENKNNAPEEVNDVLHQNSVIQVSQKSSYNDCLEMALKFNIWPKAFIEIKNNLSINNKHPWDFTKWQDLNSEEIPIYQSIIAQNPVQPKPTNTRN